MKRFANLDRAVSIGHTSHETPEECLSKCFSNFSRESKTKVTFFHNRLWLHCFLMAFSQFFSAVSAYKDPVEKSAYDKNPRPDGYRIFLW